MVAASFFVFFAEATISTRSLGEFKSGSFLAILTSAADITKVYY